MEKENIVSILITSEIDGIGGGQLYTLRRANYLKERGHKVIIVTGIPQREIQGGFYKFDLIYEKEIIVNSIFSNQACNRIVKRIKNILFSKNYEDIFIESNDWCGIIGEKIAKELEAKNTIYIITEFDINRKKGYLDFLKFKLNRNELIGVSKKTLEISFDKYWNDNYKNNYVNISLDKENLIVEKEEKIEKKEDIFKILTVARLEKKYIKNLLETSIELAKKYKDKNIEINVIGNSKEKEIENNLRNNFKSQNNIKINFLGYMYPINSKYFKESDVFVGVGTAAVTSISLKCATVCMDARDNIGAGIFGIDTEVSAYYEKEQGAKLINILEKLLLDKNYKELAQKKGYEIYKKEFLYEVTMKKLDEYCFNKNSTKKWYEFKKFILKEEIKYYLEKISLYNLILKIRNKIFKSRINIG